jgi:hypothetical protein
MGDLVARLPNPWQTSMQAEGLLHKVCKPLTQLWSRRFRLRFGHI